ncbi:hypothetical protein HK102_003530 [Quaeritorhiza haematococci]|nr:hypothetical protein HK102_003530 [Quaeritorhiza haematococci]
MEAYAKAAAESAAQRAGAAGAAASLGPNADVATRKTGMTLDEAFQILNVSKESAQEDVVKKYEHLFKVNDPQSGGSLYIQAKVYRARERIEMELAKKIAEQEEREKEQQQTS